MRRVILLSTPPNRHEGRQRRLFKGETLQSNPHNTGSGTKEARRRPPTSSLATAFSKARSLTRTRSESDLIRAMAKHKEDESRRRGSDSDDESDDSLEEDDSRRATSLRSFTKEDEERYAHSCRENVIRPGAMCSKIGEEEEESNAVEPDTKESTSFISVPDSAMVPETQSNISPVSESNDSQQQSETQSYAAPTGSTVSLIKDEYSKTSAGSKSGDSTTDTLIDSEVDVEYLLHENELLKSSLENVALERESLARDNWNLRIELENMRNQMRFMMSVSGSTPMYSSESPPMYTTGQYHHYTGMYETNQDYEQRACCTSQTFEELLGE